MEVNKTYGLENSICSSLKETKPMNYRAAYRVLFFTPLALWIACMTACSSENNSVVTLDGHYEKPIDEFATCEPVRTFLMIRDGLLEDMEAAAQLTNDPKAFLEKKQKAIELVGKDEFKKRYEAGRKKLRIQSVHHGDNQMLLVVHTGTYNMANFYIRNSEGKVLEVVKPENISKTLMNKFHEINRQEKAELAGN